VGDSVKLKAEWLSIREEMREAKSKNRIEDWANLHKQEKEAKEAFH
jgi:hypothetical protein